MIKRGAGGEKKDLRMAHLRKTCLPSTESSHTLAHQQCQAHGQSPPHCPLHRPLVGTRSDSIKYNKSTLISNRNEGGCVVRAALPF